MFQVVVHFLLQSRCKPQIHSAPRLRKETYTVKQTMRMIVHERLRVHTLLQCTLLPTYVMQPDNAAPGPNTEIQNLLKRGTIGSTARGGHHKRIETLLKQRSRSNVFTSHLHTSLSASIVLHGSPEEQQKGGCILTLEYSRGVSPRQPSFAFIQASHGPCTAGMLHFKLKSNSGIAKCFEQSATLCQETCNVFPRWSIRD